MKFDLAAGFRFGNRGVAEIEPAVAAEAGKVLAEEQNFAALGGIGYGVVVAVVMIAVVGRARGDDAPLETGHRLGDVGDGEAIGVAGKRVFEEAAIFGIGTQHGQEAVAFAQSEFDGMVAEHGDQRLFLQVRQLRDCSR